MALNSNQVLSLLRNRGTVLSKHDLDILLPSLEGRLSYAVLDNGGTPRSGLLSTPVILGSHVLGFKNAGIALSTNEVAGTVTVNPGGGGLYIISYEVLFAAFASSGSLIIDGRINGVTNTGPSAAGFLDAAVGAHVLFQSVQTGHFELNEGDVLDFELSSDSDTVLVGPQTNITMTRIAPR